MTTSEDMGKAKREMRRAKIERRKAKGDYRLAFLPIVVKIARSSCDSASSGSRIAGAPMVRRWQISSQYFVSDSFLLTSSNLVDEVALDTARFASR